MKKIPLFAFFTILSTILFAQQGKDGSPVITAKVVVNEYTYLTAYAPSGTITITVDSSKLNLHNRFAGNLAPGDLVMIIQMQGATLKGQIDSNNDKIGAPKDSSWGAVTNYNNCGNYEFAEVNAVPSATTITFDCPLQYSYSDSGKVQIVRIPRYNSLTINSGGVISCDGWDSIKGGIIAIEVQANTVINSGGSINATGLGFRGGQYNGEDSVGWGIGDVASRLQSYGKEKGEGIGGYEWSYARYGGKEGMGAPGNAGGGGNVQNSGGGGGANAGIVFDYINGFGNPDTSTVNDKTAWALEFSWLPKFTSSGGGRGGYTFSSNNSNPLTQGPNNTNWGGDNRGSFGGRGGRPLDYSTGKIFMAGGGGAGDQNDNNGGIGGNGGGIIYLMSYGTVSGGGQIISNGANGSNAHGTATFGHAAGIDGAGGAGGGGTLIVNSVGNISGVSLTANGGTGGNQVISWDFSTDPEAEGPGGGGSGGYIATSNTGLTETASGGKNGTTNAIPMINFPANGATAGGSGDTNPIITNFYLATQNDTICSGLSATLNGVINGNPPPGTTIEWYTTSTGGAPIATGLSYTTPVLTKDTVFYIGSCPGTYRIPVLVIVSNSGNIAPSATICLGSSYTLSASGGSSYSWTPTNTLNNPNIANPVATPSITTTYSVTITTPCAVVKDSVTITVLPPLVATVSANTYSICIGMSATISVIGGSTYNWSTGATTSDITVTPAVTTTYTVGISNGTCTKDTSIVITVNQIPIPAIVASKDTICQGSSTVISASGGANYNWSNGATDSSINVNPNSTTVYSVIVSNGNCARDTNITITVNPTPTVTLNPSSASICIGTSVTLNVLGGGTYLWSNSSTSGSITVSPSSSTTYNVQVTSASGCIKDDSVTVTVNPFPVPSVNGPFTICNGESVQLNASGGTTYLWSPGGSLSNADIANPDANPQATTIYTVTVLNSAGCSSIDSVKVTVIPGATGNACCSQQIVQGSSASLMISGAAAGSTFSWSPIESLSCSGCSDPVATPTVTTTYAVTITDANGCHVTDYVTITVLDETNCGYIFVPNAFSPGANVNNVLYVRGNCIESVDFEIFDRWGNRVFYSTSPDIGWDGNHNGKPMDMGTFVYLLKVNLYGGGVINKKGNVTLVR